MVWKFLKLFCVLLCVAGIIWFAGTDKTSGLGLWAVLIGIGIFVVCRIFEPTIIKQK